MNAAASSLVFEQAYGFPVTHQSGRNTNSPSGSWHDVWDSVPFYDWPTNAIELEGFSTDSGDFNIADVGARAITVNGLDVDFNAISETLDIFSGPSPKLFTDGTFRRINEVFIPRCGEYAKTDAGSNSGVITIQEKDGGPIQAQILVDSPVGFARAEMSRFSVSATSEAFILSIKFSVQSNKTADIALFKRLNADVVTDPFSAKNLVRYWTGVVGVLDIPVKVPFGPFPPKTDLWFAAKADNPNTMVAVDFEVLVTDIGALGFG